jgi:hypothetical protein
MEHSVNYQSWYVSVVIQDENGCFLVEQHHWTTWTHDPSLIIPEVCGDKDGASTEGWTEQHLQVGVDDAINGTYTQVQ